MNLKNLSLLVIGLSLGLGACTMSSSPTGEWRMSDLEFQLGFKGSLDSINTDDAWEYYRKELIPQGAAKDYQSMSPKEKDNMRFEIHYLLDSIGRKAYERMAEEAYISFYEDESFQFYIFPYYIQGNWTFSGNEIQGEITETMSVLSKKKLPKNYSKQIKFSLSNAGDRKALKILSDNFPSFWNLDTLYLKKLENRSAYRLPEKNRWRFQEKNPKAILKNHLAYLAAIFKDGLNTGKNSVSINSDCHCSPLKFYGNGISIKNKDEAAIECWRSLFDNEKDFSEAYEKLIEVFQNNAKTLRQEYENEFDRNMKFLEAMVQSI